MTPAVRALIYANVAAFVVTFAAPEWVVPFFGLTPQDVVEDWSIWQLGTYLFIHSPTAFTHILFNMLALWMFGVDLERRWGTVGFLRYYFVTGIGAGLCTLLAALVPAEWTRASYAVTTIGASGAIYGLLMAWGLLFPHRQILFMLIFPLPARMFVLIMGAIAFFAAMSASGSGVANLAHLGGLVVGWLYLKGPRDLQLEVRYWLTRWRMERLRRRFNVHKGGRGNDWQNRVH
jgi:membrane associated rhomboid family serine protease